MQPSDEIKSRLDIVDVIRDYVPLKAAGANFRANCPFHREKTPSFMVSPEKQIFHCFGCGEGGDLISFIMKIEGLSFVEALRVLAPKAGVVLQKQNPQIAGKKNRLLDILEASVLYYHDILLDSPQAHDARDYLKKRGLTGETIRTWQIGYSPDSWDDLLDHLKGRGFSENEIFSAGMSVKKDRFEHRATNAVHADEKYVRYYNRFRDRIMFPIWDANGNAVAFSARVNPAKEDTEKMGKYINSPQTLIYDKSKILFGLDKAKMEIKSHDLAVVTEGQMDVITAHQNGFKNVIASSGTALTTEQVNLIKRFTNNIALAFDMDNAGEMAAERGVKEAMRAEMNIKLIEMEEGKDPDECIKQNPGAWARAVESAQPMMEYYFEKTFKNLNPEKVDDKRKAAKKLLPLIISLGNSIEKDHWIKKLSQKIGTSEGAVREVIASFKKPSFKQEEPEFQKNIEKKAERKNREETLSETLLVLILKFPNLVSLAIDRIGMDQIYGERNQAIYRNLIIYYNNLIEENSKERASDFLNYASFKSWLAKKEESELSDHSGENSSEILRFLDYLALLGDRDFYNFDFDQSRDEAIKILLALKKHYLISRMKETERLISDSESEGDNSKIEELMLELKALSDEKREIENLFF